MSVVHVRAGSAMIIAASTMVKKVYVLALFETSCRSLSPRLKFSSPFPANDKSDKVGISHINTASVESIKAKAKNSIYFNFEK